MYNGENSLPYIIELGLDEFDTSKLIFEYTVHAVNGTPKWSTRAKSAIFQFKQNGLIYMMPEMLTMEEMV